MASVAYIQIDNLKSCIVSAGTIVVRETHTQAGPWCEEICMIGSVSRPGLPRQRSEVVKTTQLAEALSSAGIDCHVDLNYWTPQSGGSILQGE